MAALFVLLSVPAVAERVDAEKAEKAALSYARASSRLTARTNLRLSLAPELRSAGPGTETPVCHVFSMDGDGGFIIISGDDVAKPVLGYSETGTFDESNPHLAYWLETLSQEITVAVENGFPQDAQIKAAWDALTGNGSPAAAATSDGEGVDPLIETRWDQSLPYSGLCKWNGQQYFTGCIATVMAQIMNYHQYPKTRSANIPGYITRSDGIRIGGIGSTTYDWNNMASVYTSAFPGTEAQQTAVATLMRDCGVSVEMDYRVGVSGAYTRDVPAALSGYFGYGKEIGYLLRDYYSYAVWTGLMKSELDAKRPIIYGGYGKDGGHAFICDGYDADGLFHFNWGWSGNSDGYFEISALYPGELGIGGGSGGFNTGQELVIGIRPAGSEQQKEAPVYLGLSDISIKRSMQGNTLTLTVEAEGLMNLGASTVRNIYIGVALYDADDGYIDHETALSVTTGLDPGHYYTDSYPLLYSPYRVPTSLPEGTYYLYPVYAVSPSAELKIISGKYGNRYVKITVSAAGSYSTSVVSEEPALYVESIKLVEDFHTNVEGHIDVRINNIGAWDYNSNMCVLLNKDTVSVAPVVIPALSVKTVRFSGMITLQPGRYDLSLLYDPDNQPGSEPSEKLGQLLSVNVIKPELGGEVTISGVTVVGETLTAVTDFVTSTPSVALGTLTFRWERDNSIIIGAVNKTYTLDIADIGKTMTVMVTAQNATGSIISAASPKVTEFPSGLSAVKNGAARLYPNPFTDEFHIRDAEGSVLRIFNPAGRLVHTQEVTASDETIRLQRLETGVYLFRLDRDGKTTVIWGIRRKFTGWRE
jgi:hypothetical protein